MKEDELFLRNRKSLARKKDERSAENQESRLVEQKRKYSESIRGFLADHPDASFTENTFLTSAVEAELDFSYSSRRFTDYNDAYVSRIIDEATSIKEEPSQSEGRAAFVIEAPFYIYESEKITSSFARLTQYKKVHVVIESKADEMQVYLSGIKETSSYSPADKPYEYHHARQVAESAAPLDTLKKLEEDEKMRNSMMAYSREMISAFAKAYNKLFAEELALIENFEKIRATVAGYSTQTLLKEIMALIPHELRSIVHPFKDLSIEEGLKELVSRGTAMDAHRFDFHRAMEYFGYKFGGGMNKKEIDRAILVDRCPDRLEGKGGRIVGLVKKPTGMYYLFGTEGDYDFEGRGKDVKDRQLIKDISEEINSKFGKPIAFLDDSQGGTTHTYWRQVGLFINYPPNDEQSLNQINEIVQGHIDKAGY